MAGCSFLFSLNTMQAIWYLNLLSHKHSIVYHDCTLMCRLSLVCAFDMLCFCSFWCEQRGHILPFIYTTGWFHFLFFLCFFLLVIERVCLFVVFDGLLIRVSLLRKRHVRTIQHDNRTLTNIHTKEINLYRHPTSAKPARGKIDTDQNTKKFTR